MAKPKSRKTEDSEARYTRGCRGVDARNLVAPARYANERDAQRDWLYEIKLDGYRLMTRFESGKPALITRNGHDWSAKMPVLVKELASLSIESGWLDGEIVVLRDDGVPDFNALQNAFDRRTGHRDASWQIDGNIVAFAFGPVAAADQFQ